MILLPLNPAVLSISPDALETIIRSIQPYAELDVWCELDGSSGDPDASLRICDERDGKMDLTGCYVLQEDSNVDLLYIGLTSRQLPNGSYIIDTIVQAKIEGWYEDENDDEDDVNVDFGIKSVAEVSALVQANPGILRTTS